MAAPELRREAAGLEKQGSLRASARGPTNAYSFLLKWNLTRVGT